MLVQRSPVTDGGNVLLHGLSKGYEHPTHRTVALRQSGGQGGVLADGPYVLRSRVPSHSLLNGVTPGDRRLVARRLAREVCGHLAQLLDNGKAGTAVYAIGPAQLFPQTDGLAAIHCCDGRLHGLRKLTLASQRELPIQHGSCSAGGVAGSRCVRPDPSVGPYWQIDLGQ